MLSLASLKEPYEQYKQKTACTLSKERKNELLALAGDIPHLWHSTKNIQDKKRIIRLLIKDITVSKDPLTRDWLLQLRWQGGAHETVKVRPLPKIYDRQRYGPETIEKVKSLAKQMGKDGEIAQALNEQNYLGATHKAFTKAMVKWVRYKHRIPLQGSKQKDELTPTEFMHKFGISRHMVYYWIERGYVKYRKLPTHQLLIAVNANTEMELWNTIKSSYKLKHS